MTATMPRDACARASRGGRAGARMGGYGIHSVAGPHEAWSCQGDCGRARSASAGLTAQASGLRKQQETTTKMRRRHSPSRLLQHKNYKLVTQSNVLATRRYGRTPYPAAGATSVYTGTMGNCPPHLPPGPQTFVPRTWSSPLRCIREHLLRTSTNNTPAQILCNHV
ncbi:hypothetical protein C2E23DRAFT_862180 [Lenzites betulinus]|nr:hypothetical protein C2E23DRAFT_862180 [Lenzites betulinus]